VEAHGKHKTAGWRWENFLEHHLSLTP
jgi:hypothetical protein